MEQQTDRVNEQKPQWMVDYECSNSTAMNELKELIERIEAKIDPVVEAYRTAGTLGKWLKMSGTSLLLLLSIIWAWLSIKNNQNFTWLP